jgi:hypothetical protein
MQDGGQNGNAENGFHRNTVDFIAAENAAFTTIDQPKTLFSIVIGCKPNLAYRPRLKLVLAEEGNVERANATRVCAALFASDNPNKKTYITGIPG